MPLVPPPPVGTPPSGTRVIWVVRSSSDPPLVLVASSRREDLGAVWRVVRDIGDHVRWMNDAVAITFVTDRHEGVGTAFDCDTRIGPEAAACAANGPYWAWLNSILLYCTTTVPPRWTYSIKRWLFALRSSRRS